MSLPSWTERAKTAMLSSLAPVAQMDRVLPSEGRSRTFESCRAHQTKSKMALESSAIFDFWPPQGGGLVSIFITRANTLSRNTFPAIFAHFGVPEEAFLR